MQQGFPRKISTRTAEQLIALGDHHCEKFQDAEVNELFRHLWEKNLFDPRYEEDDWVILQWHLRRRGLVIGTFSDERINAVDLHSNLSVIFHRLWGGSAGKRGYERREWMIFMKQLSIREIFV